MNIYQQFKETYPQLHIKIDEPLAYYSYTKTGGPADAIVFPTSIDEVTQVVSWVNDQQVPLTVFGNLSNLIVRDGGIDGIVMILTEMTGTQIDDEGIYASSGASLIETSRLALAHTMTGLEFACGIPGSVGGAVFMNAGAYGGEVKDCIQYVDILTRDGQQVRLMNDDCHFSYRHSVFQDQDVIILGAYFALKSGDAQAIQDKMAELTQLRESKQPLEYPSCGSVFKRPEGYFTGKLIQDAGLQGYRIGGAEISKKHAGFIVNIDGATATDYTDMITYIQKRIMEEYGVALETEVRILGRDQSS